MCKIKIPVLSTGRVTRGFSPFSLYFFMTVFLVPEYSFDKCAVGYVQ